MKKLIHLLNHKKIIANSKECEIKELENNRAVNCDNYRNGICLKDSEQCYLKKINDDGLYFDCIKLIY